MGLARVVGRRPFSLQLLLSKQYAYARCIDNATDQIVVDVSSKDLADQLEAKLNKSDKPACAATGKAFAQRALELGIKEVHWERDTQTQHYHGRIRALIDAVRDAGLKFN